MIKLIIPALLALTVNASAQCFTADNLPCIGTELDQWQAQQKQQQQLNDTLQDIQNNQYQMENQLNQLQAEQSDQ